MGPILILIMLLAIISPLFQAEAIGNFKFSILILQESRRDINGSDPQGPGLGRVKIFDPDLQAGSSNLTLTRPEKPGPARP